MNAKQYSESATTREATDTIKVAAETLRRWELEGKIESTRTPGNHRRYNLRKYFQQNPPLVSANDIEKGVFDALCTSKSRILYARVSTREQKEDLERQTSILKTRFPHYELITDIGSGMSFKRKGFKTLVERIIHGEIEEIVVTHRDRLSRFGFDLITLILEKSNPKGRILVLDDKKSSPEQELSDDLISIITVFSARLYGLRSHKNAIRQLCENHKNTDISKHESDEEISADVSVV